MKRSRWDASQEAPEAKVPKRSEKLKPYEVPEPVRILCASNYCRSDDWTPEVEALLTELESIKLGSVPLNPTNYRNRLRLLNQIEDEHLNGVYRECQLVAAGVVPEAEEGKDGGVCYRFQLTEAVENAPEIRRDTEVRLTVHQKNCLHVEHSDERCKRPRNFFPGTVESMMGRFVRVRLDFKLKLPEESTVEKVEFIAERSVFRLEYRALELLKDSFIEKVLFPKKALGKEEDLITSLEWFQPSVASNEEQADAIKSIVNDTSYPAPYLLFGPPGTGKTSTLVEAIGQTCKLKPNSKILAMATSNAAANELTVRLLRILPAQRILRFFAKSLEKKKDFIDQRVMNVSNLFETPNAAGIHSKILSFQVVVCTLSTAGRLVMFKLPEGHFSHIFIDECGSAKEISCLVPIASFGIGKDETTTTSIVLAGDPKQLGPVIQCDFLDKTNHGMSLLERLTDHELYRRNELTGNYDPRVISLLRDNFRSHQALLKFPNQAFYEGQLRVKAAPELTNWAIGWRRLPNYSFPLIFHSVSGEVTRDKGSASMANVQEAKRVASYVEDILWNGINGKKITQNSIGIISPYACQVRYLKDLLKSRGRDDIEIGSTEQYQGREKAIMIISTVRSGGNGVGFLSNIKRLNVSVTRAQALMIVVGDADTLEKNESWREFIGFCRKHRAIVGSKK